MLSINMSDVMNVLNSIKSYLIAFVVVLILAIVVMIAVGKQPKANKRLIRGEACIAIVLALLIVVNLICTGPMRTMLELVSARSDLSAETTAEATELVSQIVEEGVVLAKNEDAVLPVASGSKLNVFGWASTSPCYGGTGSGALNTAYPVTDLLTGLNEAGIETNTELSQFYTDYQSTRPDVGMWAQDWTLPEPNVSLYTDELMDNAKAFSDTAMIVITRVGGEGADLPDNMPAVVDGSWHGQDGVNQSDETYYAGVYDDTMNEGNDWDEGDHFLQLDNREEEMVDLVCQNFDKVIVVYNGANAFELGWVNEHPQIKGVLLCPGTGQSGFSGFGRVVSGEVNPSGHTVDIYPVSMKDAPWWNNHGSFVYDNMKDYGLTAESMFAGTTTTENPSFVNYVEGIYVGYKFYETAAAEGLIDYDKSVVYPFGYGLSYTDFTQTMSDVSFDGTNASFSVTVTNNGTVADKDVVEVYVNPPYTNGGIEKATANLVDFAKTGDIAPGASETVDFTIPVEQLASYDYQGKGCYVLEADTYTLSANADSHTVYDAKTFDVTAPVVYDQNNKRESDKIPAVNQFDYAAGDVTYLSRKDHFANYAAATAAPKSMDMSDKAKESFYNVTNYLTAEATAADEDPDAEPITTGAATELKLKDLRGLDYDDPKWDELLNSLTIQEMNSLTSLGGYQTAAIESIGKIRTNDCDGPASINNNFTGVGSVGFPAAVLIANTWSDEVAYNFGSSIGKMADEMDTAGWYGPAMNIHRTAFAGRNFEYYSEDGILSGSIAASAIKGAQEHGVYAYMKHFALNDQEANRCSMLCTWSNEQAMREIYLRPFELSVKEGDSLAVMSSFNYIGNRWAGGTKQLCETVLRDEWGFRGFVETDYFGVYNYMSADQAIRNGTDLMLVNYPTATNDMQFTATNGAQQRLRQSAHRILYVVVNSRSYTDENYAKATGTPMWRSALTAAIEMPWLDKCKAVVHGYLCGQAGAGAVLKVITGEVNPSGKLSESYPLRYEDTPSAPYFPAKQRTVEYREGLYMGYRYFETAKVPVLFPFGYGLSYTSFAYSDLQVSETEVRFTLTNTGDRDGAEVAQLYVSAQNPSVYRPAKELKGFAKVFLRAGERKTVTIPLDDKAFRYFNTKTNRFEVDGGEYALLVGASVADIRLSGTVNVKGTNAPAPYDMEKLPSYKTGNIQHVSDAEFAALLGHPIPDGSWSGTLQLNDAICQLYYAKSLKARLVYKIMTAMLNKSIARGEPDLNIIFVYNMPFRAIGKMAGGAVSQEMCEGIMTIVNGHAIAFFAGLGKVIGGYFRQRKVLKKAQNLK